MSAPFLIEVPAAAEEVRLAHTCPGGVERPIVVQIGERARARLAGGETFPATGRCPFCGGRAFASLVDPAAVAARRKAAVPDSSALRPPPARGHLRLVQPRQTPTGEPCPACGIVPDRFGTCRCSL